MVVLRGIVATVIALACAVPCAAVDRAEAGGSENPSWLLFSGTDLWQYGGFLYGGFLWSPAGLNTDGFTLKMLLDGGKYSYVSGALHENINGTKLSAAALPGWRLTRGGLTVTLFIGPIVQDYRLTPADPGSRLHGLYVGAESAADIWYQPNALTMAALSGAFASIGPTGYVFACSPRPLSAPKLSNCGARTSRRLSSARTSPRCASIRSNGRWAPAWR